MSTPTTQNTAAFIWQVADDILRGTFKRHEYGDVTLPFVVLRRLDCAFAKTRDPLLADVARFGESLDDEQLERVLLKSTGGLGFFNKSGYDLERLASDPNNISSTSTPTSTASRATSATSSRTSSSRPS